MAFFSKPGNILRQTVRRHFNHDVHACKPSLFQAIRCMSTSTIYVGGLSYATNGTCLGEEFSKYGEVVEAKIMVDSVTGRSKGYGFVTYVTPEDASCAMQALDGQDLFGRMVRVNYAIKKPPRPRFGYGNYRGGYGNYRGGGYGGGYVGSSGAVREPKDWSVVGGGW